MNTLIIYDTTGHIVSQITGSAYEPVGIPFLSVAIPDGKYITRVDVSVTPNVAVFEDIPKSDELTRMELLENAINDILLG